jgi:hypothetical protein
LTGAVGRFTLTDLPREGAMTDSSIPPHPTRLGDDPLYRAAIAVERDERLAAEMAEWEASAVADGLDEDEHRGQPVR